MHASVNMTSSKRDYSLEYHHTICNGATKQRKRKRSILAAALRMFCNFLLLYNTFWATIELCPQGNVSIPAPGTQPYVTTSDWWKETILHNVVLVPISGEVLLKMK